MGWFGKLTFGALGLFVGGPLGAVAGAALGHHLVDKSATRPEGLPGAGFGAVEQAQAAYFVSIFSILGKMAKADGVVSREEIQVVDNFIDSMNIDDREKMFARQVFNEAKDSSYAIDDFARQFFQINRNQPPVLISFLDVLFQVAAADGRLHTGEAAALDRVREVFQISRQQFEELKARHFNGEDKYYKILNCTPQSPDEEVKKNYKKLVRDFHPDTIVSKGLPEEFMEFAAGRFREIQQAYDSIRKERGF